LYEEYPELRSLRPAQPGQDIADMYPFESCYTIKNPLGAMDRGDVAAALIVASGNYNETAKVLQRSRSEIVSFIAKDKELIALRDDLAEGFLDEMEHLQSQVARAGNGAAQRFFLTTLGSSRGFSNLQRVAGASGGAIETVTEINLVAQPIPKREESDEDVSAEHSLATEDGGELPADGPHEGI
jgi:hypothetical protein